MSVRMLLHEAHQEKFNEDGPWLTVNVQDKKQRLCSLTGRALFWIEFGWLLFRLPRLSVGCPINRLLSGRL